MTKGLEALKQLMNEYYEMCEDTGNNDDMYQKCNLTSERAIIEKELKAIDKYKELLEEKLHFAESKYNYIEAVVIRELLIDFKNIFEKEIKND